MSVFVIAEVGSCHEGKLEQAVDLIRLAKVAGADAVKFQYWSSPARLVARRRAPASLAMYTQYALPKPWVETLAQSCRQEGIAFMCTVYLPEDIATVVPWVTKFKIASFEALDMEFVKQHPADRDLIISLGMVPDSAMADVLTFRRAHRNIRYLHCVSGYPTPLTEVNLAVIRHYGLDGFSDHTGDVRMGADATLAGARIVEVHVRSMTTRVTNPDYPHALTPHALRQYIMHIRVAEGRLGQSVKCVQPSERANLALQVRSS